MENVTENTIVQLGKFYLVKCAFMKNDYGSSYFIPVIGEMHRDPQFGVDLMHYHIDGRCSEIEKNLTYDDIPLEEKMFEIIIQRDDEAIEKIYERVRKCREYMNRHFFQQELKAAA